MCACFLSTESSRLIWKSTPDCKDESLLRKTKRAGASEVHLSCRHLIIRTSFAGSVRLVWLIFVVLNMSLKFVPRYCIDNVITNGFHYGVFFKTKTKKCPQIAARIAKSAWEHQASVLLDWLYSRVEPWSSCFRCQFSMFEPLVAPQLAMHSSPMLPVYMPQQWQKKINR